MHRKIIEMQNYSYTYPRQDEPVLHDVNLCVEEGEFCLLLGRSGCGKSTLCLSINGIIPHMLGGKTKGNVIVDGKNVRESQVGDLAKIVAIVFQDPDRQLCNIEVKNEVAFALENLLFEPEDIKNRVSEALKFVGLEGYDMKNVWDLSGGEKQRLAIASALALRPKILILDEPTSNLDPVGTQEILNTIEKIRKETNCAVILVEHNLDELISNVNKVMVIDDGTIVYDGPPRKLIDEKGDYLLDNLGLWLPQYSIIGLKAREKKFPLPSVPLTINEAVKIFKNHIDQVEITKHVREKSEAIVEVENLHFTYPDGTKALNGINLRIRKGDMVAIVGKNGSGKSTLALHFVGIHKPSSGKVIVDGYDTQKVSITDLVKKVSYVFQYPEHQFVESTVFEEVAYGTHARGFSKEETEKEVCEMLSSLGLLEHRERYPTLLSMGQMRRLSVAAMLITKPSLIVLDEPTYGQDRNSARTLMEYMRKLNSDGKTIVFITHDMKLVAEYAKTVIVLNNGRVLLEGSPREVFSNKKALAECCLMPPPVFRLSDQIAGIPILTEDEFISILKE